jgi:hypothetical protein
MSYMIGTNEQHVNRAAFHSMLGFFRFAWRFVMRLTVRSA